MTITLVAHLFPEANNTLKLLSVATPGQDGTVFLLGNSVKVNVNWLEFDKYVVPEE